MLSYLREFPSETVEMGKVKRKGIIGEAKPGSAMHLISPLRHNRDSQAESHKESYGTQKRVDSSIRIIFPLYTRISVGKSKKKIYG